MYVPENFRLTDDILIRRVIADYPLAVFTTCGEDGPRITHLPLMLREEGPDLVLYGHFARANPHWKDLLIPRRAVAVFQGPQGYISPDWYATKKETGKAVPTWNYVVVHVRGMPVILEHGAGDRDVVDVQTDAMEQPRDRPWRVADAPERYTETMLRGITAFRMVVDDLTAAAKLSQNKSTADISGVRKGLSDAGADALLDVMPQADM